MEIQFFYYKRWYTIFNSLGWLLFSINFILLILNYKDLYFNEDCGPEETFKFQLILARTIFSFIFATAEVFFLKTKYKELLSLITHFLSTCILTYMTYIATKLSEKDEVLGFRLISISYLNLMICLRININFAPYYINNWFKCCMF